MAPRTTTVAPASIERQATVRALDSRHLIVNADDFGASAGINRGIVDAHRRGIVTSTSLMVDRPAAQAAAELAREQRQLAIGLHFEHDEAMTDAASAHAELDRQLTRFRELVGRDPTHLDSHHHVHRQPPLAECFSQLGADLGIPVREASPIVYIGGFYAQWEWEVTELHYVSVQFLEQILRTEVISEWTELGCHPGYVDDDFRSVYLTEREEELRTLTDPRTREIVDELGIELVSFSDYAR